MALQTSCPFDIFLSGLRCPEWNVERWSRYPTDTGGLKLHYEDDRERNSNKSDSLETLSLTLPQDLIFLNLG